MPRYSFEGVYDTARYATPPADLSEGTIARWIEQQVQVKPGTIKVERLPDPPIVEEFVVRVTSPANLGPVKHPDWLKALLYRLVGEHVSEARTVEVECRA